MYIIWYYNIRIPLGSIKLHSAMVLPLVCVRVLAENGRSDYLAVSGDFYLRSLEIQYAGFYYQLIL